MQRICHSVLPMLAQAHRFFQHLEAQRSDDDGDHPGDDTTWQRGRSRSKRRKGRHGLPATHGSLQVPSVHMSASSISCRLPGPRGPMQRCCSFLESRLNISMCHQAKAGPPEVKLYLLLLYLALYCIHSLRIMRLV